MVQCSWTLETREDEVSRFPELRVCTQVGAWAYSSMNEHNEPEGASIPVYAGEVFLVTEYIEGGDPDDDYRVILQNGHCGFMTQYSLEKRTVRI